MLIQNCEDRAARHQEKIDKILRYLVRENYSDFSTLRRLFGFKNHRGLYDLLNKLVAIGSVKKHVIGKRPFWQITRDGAATLSDIPLKTCRLAGLSELIFRRHLAMQNARLSLEAYGVTEWFNATDPQFPSQHKPRPDAILTLPQGKRAALEVDVTVKTLARYKVMMAHHLIARTAQEWHSVIFVMPTEGQRNAVRVMIESVKTLTINGNVNTLEQKHYDIFQYFTQDELRLL